MNYISCADITDIIIKEASDAFSPDFRENPEYRDVLREYCEAFDKLAPVISCKEFTAEVDLEFKTVAITAECGYFDYGRNSSPLLLDLMERALSLNFYHGRGDTVAIKFTFPSIWERA